MRDLLPPQPIPLPGPRLGLLSDSHGDAVMTRRAVAQLAQHDVDALIHLGDLCAVRVLDELAGVTNRSGATIPAFAVPGNMDDEAALLVRYAESIDIALLNPAAWLQCGERTIVAHHGHVRGVESAAIKRGVTTILHGHTHVPRDEWIDGVHYVNPGALHRARTYTAATLNAETGDVSFLEIPRRES